MSAARTSRRRVRIADPEGLHARPCARIARAAGNFRSDVAVIADGKRADARSVLSLLELAVVASAEVEIVATGEDAEACAAALAEILTLPHPA